MTTVTTVLVKYPANGKTGLFTGFKQKMKIIFRYICMFPILWICGCSGDIDSISASGDSGAITFEIKWPESDSGTELPLSAASISGTDCMDDTIETVTFAIYDKHGKLLVDMAEATFECSEGEGIVDKVPAGSGIRLVVLAKGTDHHSENEEIYLRGEYPDNITVKADTVTSLGMIDTHTYTPELSYPLNGVIVKLGSLTFEWDEVPGASTYKINVSRLYPSEARDYFSNETSFTPPDSENDFFTSAGIYYWHVTAIDAYENYGPDSSSGQFSLW